MLKNAKFTRNKEDFVCAVCGQTVHGDGYTNHCPRCLASKHVDINPGDRASECQGIMIPMAYEVRKGKEYVIHKCTKCGYIHANKISSKDERPALVSVAKGEWESYVLKIKHG